MRFCVLFVLLCKHLSGMKKPEVTQSSQRKQAPDAATKRKAAMFGRIGQGEPRMPSSPSASAPAPACPEQVMRWSLSCHECVCIDTLPSFLPETSHHMEFRVPVHPRAHSLTHTGSLYLAMALLVICIAMTMQSGIKRVNPGFLDPFRDFVSSSMSRIPGLATWAQAHSRPPSSVKAAARAAAQKAKAHATKDKLASAAGTATSAEVGVAGDGEVEADPDRDPSAPKGANRQGKPVDVKLGNCEDRHDRCAGFSAQGECTKNPGWMIVNCPKSCDACELLDPKVRCNRDRLGIKNEHVYSPGDMNAMFSSIQQTYGNMYDINVLSTDPWVVTFDNFLTDREIQALLDSVNGNWERSTDTGSSNEFGETGRVLSQGRTSNNAWCREECNRNPDVQNIMKKISDITWVPKANFEAFQVLRYEIGQKYVVHHDASEAQTRLACGTRILTFFLYLSDVEEGGETAFPSLNLAVRPKKGSALLWPSTLDAQPNSIDGRTMHEAKAVIKGMKLAANTWIHSHDFATSNLHGCTGTFDALS